MSGGNTKFSPGSMQGISLDIYYVIVKPYKGVASLFLHVCLVPAPKR